MRAPEVGVDLGFDFADDGKVAVDFGDDSRLLSRGRQSNSRVADVLQVEGLSSDLMGLPCHLRNLGRIAEPYLYPMRINGFTYWEDSDRAGNICTRELVRCNRRPANRTNKCQQ